MASLLPPPRGVAFTFDMVLFAQADNQIKTTPTLAAGDFVVAKADGTDSLGATANLTTTPSEAPASSGIVKISLSATEMTADRVLVKWHDASGAEWHDGALEILTSGQTFDTMDTNIDSILADTGTDGVKIADDAITAGKFDESTAFPLKSADTGATQVARVGADGDTLETLSDQIDAAALEATAQSILADTGEIGAAGAGLTALATQTSVNDLPTNSELTTALAAADDAVLAAIAALNDLSSAGAQAAAAAALAAYDAATGSDISGLNDLSAAEVNAEVVDVLRTDTIPDSYAADGAQPTIAQAVLMLLQFLSEREVSGTTITVNKPDGATAAMTFTLDDASNPTSITRAS